MSLRHEHKGTGGGGLTDIAIISSRNTIEVEREGNVFDVNIAGETREFYVKDFTEFMDAVKTCAEAYLADDPVQNVIKLLDHIDMTEPTEEDEAKYVVNGNALIDRANKEYHFGVYLYRTKIVSHGQQRALQLLYPVTGQYFDIWQISVVRFICENIGIGGEIAVWSDHFHHGSVANLPVRFQRYLLSSNGNFYYWLKDCTITCCGAPQNELNSFNPFIKMGNASNSSAGLWVTNLTLENSRFIAGDHAVNGGHANLNAPIVINSEYRQNRAKEITFKQMSKQVNDSDLETNVPNIQLRSDVPNDVKSNWESYKWSTFSDGSVLFSCDVSEDCIIFTPKLAVNDLYLQGTELTPEGNPPTENYVSLVEILKKINITFDFGATNSGQTLLCVADVTSLMTGHIQPVGLAGMLVALPPSSAIGSEVVLQRIIAYGSSSPYPRLMIDNDTNEGIAPFIIQYSSKYYLALSRKRSEFYTKVSLLGQTYGLNISPFRLYSNPAGTSWFSDEGHTQTVSLSFVRNPEAIRTWFGGTTDKVVAGDGSLLNWSDKLGYWIGTTANLPTVGSREANKLYITTDY